MQFPDKTPQGPRELTFIEVREHSRNNTLTSDLLLQENPDNYRTCVHESLISGYFDMIEPHVSHDMLVRPDRTYWTPLHYAAIHGHIDQCEGHYTVEDLSLKAHGDWTPLQLLAESPERFDAVPLDMITPEALLERNLNRNCALDLLAINGGLHRVEHLLNEDLLTNCYPYGGYTPLHMLFYTDKNDSIAEDLEAIRPFLNNRTLLTPSTQPYGETPIHMAAQFGKLDLIAEHLTAENMTHKDKFGRTPLDYAKQYKHLDQVPEHIFSQVDEIYRERRDLQRAQKETTRVKV